MSKHTPGPWIKGTLEWVGSNGRKVVVSDGPSFGSKSQWPDAEANSSLITAAPDLLEALEALVKSNEDHNARVSLIVGKPTGWHDGYLDKARSAIAKARGEA